MSNMVKKMTVVRTILSVVLLLLVSFASGCAPAAPKQRVLWPPPPNQPRLEWVGTYATRDELPKTDMEKLGKAILGGDSELVFQRPFGVVSDGKGRVYVSDADTRQITIYDFARRSVYPFPGNRALSSPFGMAVDSKGNFYVVDAGRKKILVFDPENNPLYSFGSDELMMRPIFLAIDEIRNKIYVSDAKGHKIVVFDLQGQYLDSFGEWGAKEGDFYSPQGLAVDKDGNLYVADMFNARVQVFDADGKFLRMFGERGDRQWNFEMPKGLAIDSDGNLHITDARKAALVTYSPEGKPLLFTGGGRSMHPLDLTLPAGVWVDQNDRIYVADQMNRWVVIWQYLNARYLEEHPVDIE